ncbi:hypothetical protein H4217_008660 [Coemansia sp. RSA 1939]|nr:hypothetical protein H4217_008660 [Coemansia sp. RSA 1939]
MPSQVTRVALKHHVPGGYLKESDFSVEKAPAPTKDQLKEGQVLLQPLYYSVDPYQRGRISGTKDSYVDSYAVGQIITNFLVGKVVASASKDFKEGEVALHNNGRWESEYIVSAKELTKPPAQGNIDPLELVGVLSMPSYTAYYGLVVIGKPKAGETILVSSASGAVGQMVVQLAKARGLKVVAVAGSDDKVEYVKSLGADVAFNYKTCGDYTEAIKKAAPQGIDIYFDNVGGSFLDGALANINPFARIIVCGAITQYNLSSPDQVYGVKNFTRILTKKASVQGYIILDHYNTKEQSDFFNEVSRLYKEGKIKYKVDQTEGLDNAPRALINLYEGKNFGKSVIKAKL